MPEKLYACPEVGIVDRESKIGPWRLFDLMHIIGGGLVPPAIIFLVISNPYEAGLPALVGLKCSSSDQPGHCEIL